jgi:hypothetical protein
MPEKLCLSNHLTLNGVLVAVLLSASSAFAGALEDTNAASGSGRTPPQPWLVRPLAEQGDAKGQAFLGDL